MIRASVLRSRLLPRTCSLQSLASTVFTNRALRTVDAHSTESDSAGEQETGPDSTRPLQSGQGLEGRKLQLGYGGGMQGAGRSFRTPEQEAAEDARRMRLFRGMQATVVLVVLSTAVMVALAIIEENAAVGCAVETAVTRTEEIPLTVDTALGLRTLTVRCT